MKFLKLTHGKNNLVILNEPVSITRHFVSNRWWSCTGEDCPACTKYREVIKYLSPGEDREFRDLKPIKHYVFDAVLNGEEGIMFVGHYTWKPLLEDCNCFDPYSITQFDFDVYAEGIPMFGPTAVKPTDMDYHDSDYKRQILPRTVITTPSFTGEILEKIEEAYAEAVVIISKRKLSI